MAETPVERRELTRKPPKTAAFKSRLRTVEEPDGTRTLLKDLVYASVVAETVFRIPKGFNTDFASVPRWPVMFWLFGDTARGPAVVHDFLYRKGIGTRAMADAVFREAMAVAGVPAWRRIPMWLGVRLGGRGSHIDTTKVPEAVPTVYQHAKPFE